MLLLTYFYIKKHQLLLLNNLAYLDEETYLKKLGNYQPLSDFWQIGKNTEAHLNKLNIFTMNDLLKKDEHLLYKEFGQAPIQTER